MTDEQSAFERGFREGYEAGMMAAAGGALPAFAFADVEMARRFGVRLGERVRVIYGDDGQVIGAFATT